jgi:hypothetical protein
VEESTITSTPKWYTANAKTKLHTQQQNKTTTAAMKNQTTMNRKRRAASSIHTI